jgi:hypothetical protein
MLVPHIHTVPSELKAKLWRALAATATALFKPETCTGDERFVVVASPSCPLSFRPHAKTVPLDVTASTCVSAAAIAFTFVNPGIGAGVERFVAVPSPSWP